MANIQEQEYRLIVDWSDIEKRPNFILTCDIQNDDEARGKLGKLIAPYQFKDKVKCGIGCCGQSHQIGYLVNLISGEEIIIGNKCGKKFFGVEFTDQTKQINLKRSEAEHYKILEQAFIKINSIKNDFNDVLTTSGKLSFYDLQREIKTISQSNDLISYWMIKQIRHEISSNGNIYEEAYKSSEEIKIERESKRNPLRPNAEIYIDPIKKFVIASIDSYEIISQWHEATILKNYFDELFTKLKHPQNMTKENRKKLVRMLSKFKNNLLELKGFCQKGNRLFQKDNLLKAKVIFRDSSHKLAWDKWVKSLS